MFLASLLFVVVLLSLGPSLGGVGLLLALAAFALTLWRTR